jgi:hypothetical protein
MTSHPPAHVHSTVESICELGCDRVNEIIDALENGHSVEEVNGLDIADQQWVLVELKAIMSVYDSDQA